MEETYEQTLNAHRETLAAQEKAGDRAGMADTYHQMGLAAQAQGAPEDALSWFQQSLAIQEELDNRLGMAESYHQIGTLAQQRGAHEEALEWYHKSEAIERELDNRLGLAHSYGQISKVLTEMGKPEEALPYGLHCLGLCLHLEAPHETALILQALGQKREVLGEARFRELTTEHLGEEEAGHVVALLDRVAAATV